MSFKFEKNITKNKTNIYHRIYLEKLKLYINHINNNFDEINTNLEKIFKKIEPTCYIFSDEGCFINKFSKISRIEFIDTDVEKKTITHLNEDNEYFEHNVIIDNSKEVIRDEISQIPYNHTTIKNERIYYSINEKSNIRLVFIKNNDTLDEFYFECFDDIDHFYIKDDFFTLLSLLN